MGKNRQGSILSVEVSSASLRAVVLERTDAGRRVMMWKSSAIPPPSSPEARQAGFASALRDIAHAVDEGPGRETIREVRVVVSGPALTLRSLRIPPMPAREIAAAVQYRLPEICTTPVENLALDILAYGEGGRRGTGHQAVLVAAIERKELDEIVGAFESAGLRPTAVIPLGVALLMAESIPTEAGDGAGPSAVRGTKKGEPMRGVLHVGAMASCLVLERGGRMLLTRDIGLGGDHFTQALMRDLGLGLDEAEKMKHIHGIPSESETAAPGEDPSLVPSIRNVLRPLAERLVAEVKRSIEFTMQEHGGPALGGLMITGEGAALRGLDRDFEADLGVMVRAFRLRADALTLAPALGARLEPEGKLDDTLLASQSAACLGAAWENPPINLMAPLGLSSAGPRGLRAAALGLAGILVLGLYGGSLWRADRRLDDTLRVQEARIRAVTPRSVSREALSPELLRNLGTAIDFERTFRELNGLMPPAVVLDGIRLQPQTPASPVASIGARVLRVEGYAEGSSDAVERSLARLLAAVESSRVFANVQRVRSGGARLPGTAARPGKEALRFAFTCDIEAGGAWHEGGTPAEEP